MCLKNPSCKNDPPKIALTNLYGLPPTSSKTQLAPGETGRCFLLFTLHYPCKFATRLKDGLHLSTRPCCVIVLLTRARIISAHERLIRSSAWPGDADRTSSVIASQQVSQAPPVLGPTSLLSHTCSHNAFHLLSRCHAFGS